MLSRWKLIDVETRRDELSGADGRDPLARDQLYLEVLIHSGKI